MNTSPEQTLGSYGKTHSHKYFIPSYLARLDPLGFEKKPAHFTLYAICVRTLEFAKQKPGKSPARQGG